MFMKRFQKFKSVLNEIGYYVYALCELDGERRVPFYIGKGKGERCLQHLSPTDEDEKGARVLQLISENRLGIDILRHGIKTEKMQNSLRLNALIFLVLGISPTR